ncbi:hypothetical protein P9K31_12395 [Corynebacterium glutamicum]|uniref:hypothetical protein n=1 Tax=Corynebacterium TaxID=1716 RepID=UPI00071ED600|nr:MULTISPECIES: hypothetical protein [Corynebacterium]ALP49216.1 hypothetical protein AC079_02760 [Corynebacterium glutamicum]ANR61502.1 hypothetical protein C628_02570 [[Brevibacterium] flavum ZL-1]ANR64502.1 hypothetical protein C627_02570 [Corynebacterium glutamicum ZL-6]ANU32731.1 hypothetical protein BBD29_02580 [Corynebacterium glutamicum]APT06472.1 hypothetical protein BSP99_02645 [Corynebacterium glutamicum]
MSMLPNLTPKKSAPPSSSASAKNPGEKKEDTVKLLIQMWAVMIGLELLHQILNVVMSFTDPTALRTVAKEQAAAQGLSDGIVNATVIAAILVMGFFNLIVIAILSWMVVMVKNRSKRLPTAFLLLTIFSFFFILRVLMLFFASPGGTDVPMALFAIDGCVQILVGVSAGVAYALSRTEQPVKMLTDYAPEDAKR